MSENQLTKTERIFFISRAIGRYFALKRYAVCRECALPWPQVQPDLSLQRADLLCVDKTFQFVIVETKSSWEDFRSDSKWSAYLDWCHQFYFAADTETALRIAASDSVRKTRVGVLAVDEVGQVKALHGALRRNPPTLYTYRTQLLLNIVFRLSPYEMNGKLRRNTCFFPNDYFEKD